MQKTLAHGLNCLEKQKVSFQNSQVLHAYPKDVTDLNISIFFFLNVQIYSVW